MGHNFKEIQIVDSVFEGTTPDLMIEQSEEMFAVYDCPEPLSPGDLAVRRSAVGRNDLTVITEFFMTYEEAEAFFEPDEIADIRALQRAVSKETEPDVAVEQMLKKAQTPSSTSEEDESSSDSVEGIETNEADPR